MEIEKIVKKSRYIELKDLEVYQLARQLSEIAWNIYENLNFQDKKNMGAQFINSTDSIGANLVEGYGRYHYLDRIKFYYNSRGSLFESWQHWLDLLFERKKINEETYNHFSTIAKGLLVKLNNLIKSIYRSKKNG